MKAKNVAIVVALFALAGIAGRFDYEDAKREEALYCENVHFGIWPDYEGIRKHVCEEKYGAMKKLQIIRSERLTNKL